MNTRTNFSTIGFEILNPIETKKIIGGNWYDYHDIPEVVIPWDGGGGNDGGWWGNDPWYPDNGGGDYGGGSGGSGGGPGQGSLPSAPTHMCLQTAGVATCATMALNYVANYFGGTGLTSSDFAEFAGQNFVDMMSGLGGLNTSQMQAAVNTFFQNTIIDGSNGITIANELNAGHPILGTIDQGGGVGHEVVIVGFDSGAGTVTYMDSLVGGVQTYNVSTITFTGSLFAISGLNNNSIVNKYKTDTNDISGCSICGH
ncbi:C39 family peptidase [Chryseobacterium sp. SSA4.19]|uniref:C39 family peptidase n=1 Tax=Chryseobacterium sp. SSA4.19 TaxID=2919915 RepID=UPI001F4EAC38|nr:C39 family peptidase [Chryseobacterium sp. SSA4.19]MCJ8153287.1 C39 family peptidase [Chryseobacterium sp. SSA4.19]